MPIVAVAEPVLHHPCLLQLSVFGKLVWMDMTWCLFRMLDV